MQPHWLVCWPDPKVSGIPREWAMECELEGCVEAERVVEFWRDEAILLRDERAFGSPCPQPGEEKGNTGVECLLRPVSS